MLFVSETKNGDKVEYRDTKRYLWILSVITPGAPALGAAMLLATGNLLWSSYALVIYFLVIPIMDMLVGEDDNNPPDEVIDAMAEDPYYRALLFCTIPVYFISFGMTAYVVGTQSLPLWAFIAITLGCGTASGAGLTVGHELGHKLNPWDQWGAKLVNAVTGYGHFCIEHNRGHHLHVATPEDAASARMGESVWRFALREIPATARRGWALERERLAKKRISFWNLHHNDILQGYAISALIAASVIAAFGWIMVPFLLLHHAMGWLQLTFANYVEHYGLKRERMANGKYEPCQPKHSWNTNHIISNLGLFHLQRHSDHHSNPMRPYQALRNFSELPRLPSGYPGTYLLAMMPPIWFKIMNPKVMAWAGGDISKTNHVGLAR